MSNSGIISINGLNNQNQFLTAFDKNHTIPTQFG